MKGVLHPGQAIRLDPGTEYEYVEMRYDKTYLFRQPKWLVVPVLGRGVTRPAKLIIRFMRSVTEEVEEGMLGLDEFCGFTVRRQEPVHTDVYEVEEALNIETELLDGEPSCIVLRIKGPDGRPLNCSGVSSDAPVICASEDGEYRIYGPCTHVALDVVYGDTPLHYCLDMSYWETPVS